MKAFGFLALLLVPALLLAGCTQTQQAEKPVSTPIVQASVAATAAQAEAKEFNKGVSLSPKSFSQEDFTMFFVKAKQAGGLVSWAGDWNQLEGENAAPQVLAQLAPQNGLETVIQPQFFLQDSGQLLRDLNESAQEEYKAFAAEYARKYKPKYLGLGIEVNVLYEKNPQEFNKFVSFYGTVYDAVKQASPSTKVFTVFQLEKMKGLNGGLFGGENNESKNEWLLLEKFGKTDLIAFTTYPNIIFKSPSEIPADYYSSIRQKTSKPVAFTEIGWHSAPTPQGWESSEEEQEEFVKTFFSLTKSLKQEFSVWSFLYDQKTKEPFDTAGLYASDGKEKKAWKAWLQED